MSSSTTDNINVSTSIRIRQTPERRRKSLDGNEQTRVSSPEGVYCLQHKTASRSLDDLIDSLDDIGRDAIMVNGSMSSDLQQKTATTVKSAVVIHLTGRKESADQSLIETISVTTKKEKLIGGDSNNNNSVSAEIRRYSLNEDDDDDDCNRVVQKEEMSKDFTSSTPHAAINTHHQQRRKLRNKSASDVLDMKTPRMVDAGEDVGGVGTFAQNSFDVSASVDNIYENGQYTKLVESDNETLDDGSTQTLSSRSSSGKSRKPMKPKRSNASLNRTFDYDHGKVLPPLDIGDREIAKYHRELNTSFDEHNNLSISKENFDAFISREKRNYSGEVLPPQSFVSMSDDDLSSDVSPRSRVQSWGSESANGSLTHESLETKPVESKAKELGEVLDSQLNSLENLLSASVPPRRSSANYGRRARSFENVCERKRLSDIEETQSRQNSRKNMNRLSHDVLSDHRKDPSSPGYIEPQNRNTLPSPPRGMSFKDRVKSIKRSLSMSKKRDVKKNGRNNDLHGLRKSFRSLRSRKRSVSLKDVSEQKVSKSSSNVRLSDDQNVVLRREASARRLFADNRSSRVIAHECDVMKTQLSMERQKVGLMKCFTSYIVHESNINRL